MVNLGITCPLTPARRGRWLESQLDRLRKLRDVGLRTTPPGRWLVAEHYRLSPALALIASRNKNLKSLIRAGLAPAVHKK